jgi:hypothetical protein
MLVLTTLAAGLPLHAAPGRVEITLNGGWETATATSLEQPPGQAEWKPFQVPGCTTGIRGEKSWFRRRFTVPADWAGQRVFVVYDGVKFSSRHFLNGTLVGEHFRGYDRFALDLTPAIRFGAENELLVGCCDWQSTFAVPVDLSDAPVSDVTRDRPRDVGLTPIGGVFYQYGLWGDVKLLTVPPVHQEDVTIRTSIRRKELRIEAVVANLTDAPRTATLGGAVVEAPEIVLPERRETVPPGQRLSVVWEVPWPNPKLWDFEQPNLYHLKLVLQADGQAADQQDLRFGFREFWCEGPRFRLNGTRLLLRSSSMWPLPEQDRESAAGRLRKMKGINVICFRTHTQPWRQHWYDAADEVGMLMIPEGPVFNDDTYYRLGDDRFWDNYADELRSMVGRLKNNPSVVAYSLENEFFGSALNDASPAKAKLVLLGGLVRQLDPTRPFMYESDGDPGRIADIEGVHYPHELGDVWLYPDAAYWLDQPKRIGHMFLNGRDSWTWERRKPLYIGEYLWCPCPSPDLYSILCGDDAYRNYSEYSQRAIGLAWSFQTRAYRASRVSGLCPWTCAGGSLDPSTDPMAAAQAESMRPLAAFPKEYNTRFFGGRSVRRTLHLMNDTLRGGLVKVRWTFAAQGAAAQEDTLSYALDPVEFKEAEFEFTPPAVERVTPAGLVVRATLEGAPDFEERIPCKVYPPPSLRPVQSRVGLLARAGDGTGKTLAGLGLQTRAVPGLDAIPPELGILIVGRDALPRIEGGAKPILRVGAEADPYAGLVGFVRRGGRALLLAQTEAHVPLGPIRFVPRQSTLAFPLAAQHPVLASLAADDLRFWAPGHIVAEAQLSRAMCGLRSLVVSGAASGLDYTALAEGQIGAGVLVACGLRIPEVPEDEPAAAVLLDNLLQYLDRWQPAAGGWAAVTSDQRLAGLLESLDLEVPVFATPEAVPAGTRGLLLGADAEADQVRQALERVGADGTVWWHRPRSEAATAWLAEHTLSARIAPTQGPVRLVDNPFTDGLARADLYWIQDSAPGAHGWQPRGLDPAIVDSALELGSETPDPARATATLVATAMRVTGSEWNRPLDGGMILASIGTLSGELEVATASAALIGFRAKGSACQGVWPQVGVAVNGEDVGLVTVNSSEWALYGCRAMLRPGKATVTLSFLNDGSAGNEDRNVWFREVMLQPAEALPVAVTVHTRPATLASVKTGNGTLLLDTIRWDEPGPHAGRARTWLAGLLLKLGARSRLDWCASVEAEELEFEAVAHNAVQGGVLCLANPGSVWAPVHCSTPGPALLRVHARGSQAKDEWPILVVSLDGTEVGRLTVDSASTKPCPLPVALPAGEHRLELRFVNDFYDPGKADRNVWLDRLELRPQGAAR